MKLPIAWLKEFVKITWSPQELAHRLTMAGFEVEAMEGERDRAVLDVNITPNRGDCLSVLGLAREVSALQGRPLKFKPTAPPPGEGPIKNWLCVKVLDKKGCPRYMARAILGVTIQPSPAWLQQRLLSLGLRPINNVVDATNYVMVELGHPLHPFDYRFLNGQKIVVCRGKENQKFTTLDGETRACEPTDLFICDGQGPVALAGIMGGVNSEVRGDTKDIVIEAAYFDPKTIHASAHRLKLASESSYRFERGVDPNGVANALHRVTQLIVETAGGTPTIDWVDSYPKKIFPTRLFLKEGEVERHLGIKIATTQIESLLKALNFKVTRRGPLFQVQVPTFRNDIWRSIDLIEEIGRLFGYDRIPESQPQVRLGFFPIPKAKVALEQAESLLLGLGFTESCQMNFTSLLEGKIFAPNPLNLVSLSNPLSPDQSVLRPSLTPGLLKAAAFNANRQCKTLKLFEVGKVFAWKQGQVREEKHLGMVAYGEEFLLQWQLKKKEIDFYTLKGALSNLWSLWRLDVFELKNEPIPPFLAPAQSTLIQWQQETIGWLGLVQPLILANYDIKEKVYVCELSIQKIIDFYQELKLKFRPISKFPFVERDLALVVDEGILAGKIKTAIAQSRISWIQAVHFFDLYQGDALGPSQKSIALRIRYASPDQTLTNEEVNRAHQSLIAHLEKTIPARLRWPT